MISQAKLVVALAAAVGLSVAISLMVAHYNKLQQDAAVGELRGTVITTTSGVLDDSALADQARAAVAQGIAEGRDQFKNQQREAQRHEPETAVRADRPVPDSVRNNYRERRRARERSGCVRAECEARQPAGDARQR